LVDGVHVTVFTFGVSFTMDTILFKLN